MNYYRRYVGDYLRDTAELSLREHGAYTLLLDYYYANEKPITGNRNSVYRLVRAMDAEDKAAVDFVLQQFFEETPEGFRQKRVDHEIQVSEKARINGKRGGRPVTGSETGSKTEKETGSETGKATGSVHPPTTNHQPVNTLLRKVGETGVPPCPHLEIIEAYHRLLPMGRRVNPELWNGTRATHLKARWRENPKRQNLEWWERFFGYIGESKFLVGQVPPPPGRTPFELNLDWIVNPTNFAKIHEGSYHK